MTNSCLTDPAWVEWAPAAALAEVLSKTNGFCTYFVNAPWSLGLGAAASFVWHWHFLSCDRLRQFLIFGVWVWGWPWVGGGVIYELIIGHIHELVLNLDLSAGVESLSLQFGMQRILFSWSYGRRGEFGGGIRWFRRGDEGAVKASSFDQELEEECWALWWFNYVSWVSCARVFWEEEADEQSWEAMAVEESL